MQALENRQVNDFEVGMEYYAAVNNKCDAIITEDIGDYYFSEIKVCRAQKFLKEYLF